MRSSTLRCDNCGAMRVSGSCSYCGAIPTTATGDLIAAGFGDGPATWRVPTSLAAHGIAIAASGEGAIDIAVPPATEIGDAIIPAGWVPGEFADVDVEVAVRFANPPPEGLAAGFWLRSSEATAISVMLWPRGTVTIATRREAGAHVQPLGRAEALLGFDARAAHVLRARLAVDLITVYRDGHVVASVPCPADLHGGTELRIQVAERERATVHLADPAARLP